MRKSIESRSKWIRGDRQRGARHDLRVGAKPDDVVRVRRSAGKRPFEAMHPDVWPALEKFVDPVTRGDPESPLRWTCKSTRVLAGELFARHGIRVSDKTVAKLLRDHGYSLQAPNKAVEGKQHPDRNAQFEHINKTAQQCLDGGIPVVSVDTKKKELVGNFKNGGREWQPKGEAQDGFWREVTVMRPGPRHDARGELRAQLELGIAGGPDGRAAPGEEVGRGDVADRAVQADGVVVLDEAGDQGTSHARRACRTSSSRVSSSLRASSISPSRFPAGTAARCKCPRSPSSERSVLGRFPPWKSRLVELRSSGVRIT